MLLGQALHQVAGCDHSTGSWHEHVVVDRPDGDGFSENENDHHDADSCPICQFHTQAQHAASVVDVCWHGLPGRELLADAYVGIAAHSPRSYSSRAPPRA
jgi:hypothetical protein